MVELDTQTAAERLRDAEAELEGARDALPDAVAAVDAARERKAVDGATKEVNGAFLRAHRAQSAAQDRLYDAEAAVRVARRAAAAADAEAQAREYAKAHEEYARGLVAGAEAWSQLEALIDGFLPELIELDEQIGAAPHDPMKPSRSRPSRTRWWPAITDGLRSFRNSDRQETPR